MGILQDICHLQLRTTLQRLHTQAEKTPFLSRYVRVENNDLTPEDHYKYLVQLQWIYRAFEQRLSSKEFQPALPPNLAFLLQRGNEIQKDLDFLNPYVTAANKNVVTLETNAYSKHLLAIPNDENGNYQLLAHFLVSILGDLHGGTMILQHKIKTMYAKHDIPQKDHDGIEFYNHQIKTLIDLEKWVEEQIRPQENSPHLPAGGHPINRIIGNAAIDAFQNHINISNGMENRRKGIAPGLFNRYPTAAPVITGLAIGVGLVASLSRLC